MSRILLISAILVLAGCPVNSSDECEGPDPHPECPNVGTADAGRDVAGEDDEDGGSEDMPGDATDMPVDAGPCGGACADPTPICDSASDTCVECLSTTDCASGVCDSGSNTCVECLANTDCTDATASTCDTATNTCVPCAASADCSHLTDTTVCDAAEGTCVECTGTEYDACDGVCDSRANTCTSRPAADVGLCGECVSDAECRAGMVCVPQMFDRDDGTGEAEVGTFCLWERDATVANAPNGACSTVRPYVNATQVMSIDGTMTTACELNVTTCPAYRDFSTDCSAPGADEECGADGFDDGLCVMFDAAANRCTVPCLGDDDCDSQVSCDTGATPKRCMLTTN